MTNLPRKKASMKVLAFIPQAKPPGIEIEEKATTQIKVREESATQMVKTR